MSTLNEASWAGSWFLCSSQRLMLFCCCLKCYAARWGCVSRHTLAPGSYRVLALPVCCLRGPYCVRVLCTHHSHAGLVVALTSALRPSSWLLLCAAAALPQLSIDATAGSPPLCRPWSFRVSLSTHLAVVSHTRGATLPARWALASIHCLPRPRGWSLLGQLAVPFGSWGP